MFEIERKFLLTEKEAKEWLFFGKANNAKTQSIIQAYLLIEEEEKSVWRVRICESPTETSAVWTFKKGTADPQIRIEEEFSMSVEQAKRLIALSERVIKKTRTKIYANGHCFDLDIFNDEHNGLFLLETELPKANSLICWPEGLPMGLDVTNDAVYRNEALANKTKFIRFAKTTHVTSCNPKKM